MANKKVPDENRSHNLSHMLQLNFLQILVELKIVLGFQRDYFKTQFDLPGSFS